MKLHQAFFIWTTGLSVGYAFDLYTLREACLMFTNLGIFVLCLYYAKVDMND